MAQVYLPERTHEEQRSQRGLIPTTRDTHERGKVAGVARSSGRIGWPDLVGVVALIIAGAGRAVSHTRSVNINLSPAALPLYASYSLLPMACAYILSLAFTLI